MENFTSYLTQYGLSEDLIQDIVLRGKQVKFKRGEKILNIGEACNHIYFITKGGFISQDFNEDKGEFRTNAFFIENYLPFMTQPESYFKKLPTENRIKAFTNSEVIAFHRKDIDELSATYKSFDKFNNAHVMEVLIMESQIKSKLISLSKSKLYSYLIERHNAITINVPSKYIAEFMGVTPQWLSRIKRTI